MAKEESISFGGVLVDAIKIVFIPLCGWLWYLVKTFLKRMSLLTERVAELERKEEAQDKDIEHIKDSVLFEIRNLREIQELKDKHQEEQLKELKQILISQNK